VEAADVPEYFCDAYRLGFGRIQAPADGGLGTCRAMNAVGSGAAGSYELTQVAYSADPNLTIAYGPRVDHALQKVVNLEHGYFGPSDDVVATTRGTLTEVFSSGSRAVRKASFTL